MFRPKEFQNAFTVGKSSKNDVQIWKEKGGFEYDYNWNGYLIEKVEYIHDKRSILNYVAFRIEKKGSDYNGTKTASLFNIKNYLLAEVNINSSSE